QAFAILCAGVQIDANVRLAVDGATGLLTKDFDVPRKTVRATPGTRSRTARGFTAARTAPTPHPTDVSGAAGKSTLWRVTVARIERVVSESGPQISASSAGGEQRDAETCRNETH